MNRRRSRKIEPTAQALPRLELRLLGTMVVGSADATIALPRSRKTRALLAYLALSPRPVRRERLCEIFWDVPDDPRAALRWSLSKLRRVIDSPDCTRLIADRDTVALDRQSIDIDAVQLREVSERPQDWSTQELTHLAGLDELLEGLDLKGCVEFQSWLVAERATLQRARQNLLHHLLERHEADPETALKFARALVDADPFDAEAWRLLVGGLLACGRREEAAQQRELALRSLEQAGLPTHGLEGGHVANKNAAASLPAQEAARQTPAIDGRPSVAVLPFTELGADAVRGGLGDAFAHDVIVELSRRRWLIVIARGSTFQFQSQQADLANIGRVLDVRYALTGYSQRDRENLRVAAELTECDTGHVLWADGFERPYTEIFAVRQAISEQIAASVSQEIEHLEIIRARDLDPADLGAWARYHRGLAHVFRFNREDNEIARQLFLGAVEDDPTFSSAYAALSFTHFQRAFVQYAKRTDAEIRTAVAFAERSLDLDPRNPQAHYAYGRACLLGGNFAASVEALETSTKLEPSFAHGHYALGMAQCQAGDPNEAIRNVQHAARLSPIDPLQFAMASVQALAEIRLGHFDEAAQHVVRSAAKPNAHAQAHALAAAACMLAGREKEARAYANEVRKRNANYSLNSFQVAFPNFNAHDRETILAPLRDLGFV